MGLNGIIARVTGVCLALSFIFCLPGTARSEILVPDTKIENAARSVLAESAVKPDTGGQQAAVSLEQAIKIAKEALTVPGDFDRFDTGFEQSEKNAFWELRWYRTSASGGSMDVRVNAQNGEIWRMYKWLPVEPGQEYRGLPKYSREQAEVYAAAFAEKVQPERFKLTKLQPDRGQDHIPLLFEKRGQVEYRYSYARVIKGLPYPENGISVTVSGDTGEVISFEVNWADTQDFPPVAGRITSAQAEQVFRTESGPALFYFRPQIPGGKEVPLKLVYRLPNLQDRVLIDALTGKLLNQEYELYGYYDMGGSDEMLMGNSKQMASELSPVEEAAVKKAENLLSMDKALALAKSLVKIPQEYTLNNSRLEQDYMFKEKRTWHFNWQTGDEADRKWLDVSVDASTGELVSFSNNNYYKYDPLKTPEVIINEEVARKKAEDFIKKVQPNRWGQVLFRDSRPELGPVLSPSEKPLPRSYTFEWSRVVNDIQFPQNGFYVSVDSSTGEVANYRMNWWDVDFPKPQGAIGSEAAATRYLQQAPLEQVYMRIWPRNEWMGAQNAKVYLVYHMSCRNFAMLDAFTGQPLNYEGKVVELSGAKVKFNDLAGHPAREAVEQLARAGIVSGEGGMFRPEDTVTQAELITMLVKSSASRYEIATRMGTQKEPWYQKYYKIAARTGIIPADEQPDPDAAVTRECLARLTVHAMGLYKVARLSDIYVLDFMDAGEISAHLRGHAAIAVGLGLVEPVDGNFKPQGVVTRAEAAVTVFKMLNSNQ